MSTVFWKHGINTLQCFSDNIGEGFCFGGSLIVWGPVADFNEGIWFIKEPKVKIWAFKEFSWDFLKVVSKQVNCCYSILCDSSVVISYDIYVLSYLSFDTS